MDLELRNLKDFLTLYNQVTELCFKSCVDNFFGRDLSSEEVRCTDNCVGKFSNVNQRLMQVYVGVQNDLNQRRMVEFEAQQAKLAEAQKQQEQAQVTEVATAADANLVIPGSTAESPATPEGVHLESTGTV